jgi:hypothetical protein
MEYEVEQIRVVVCAAIQNKHGEIIAGPRHLDDIMRNQIARSGGHERWKGAEQGFIDQRGVFLTREQALAIAKHTGQIRRRCGGDIERLFSENLY